jgi:hypothetical protein
VIHANRLFRGADEFRGLPYSNVNGGDATRWMIPCERLQSLGFDVGLSEVHACIPASSESDSYRRLMQEVQATRDLILDADRSESIAISRYDKPSLASGENNRAAQINCRRCTRIIDLVAFGGDCKACYLTAGGTVVAAAPTTDPRAKRKRAK